VDVVGHRVPFHQVEAPLSAAPDVKIGRLGDSDVLAVVADFAC
jgi:hypothetical protein